MAIAPTYPGVYIEEVPSGVRTIIGVSTSITAFIGRTLRGQVNEPIIVDSFGKFKHLFGGLATDHTVAYAVKDFFNNGGSQAIIVRLYKPFFPDDAARAAAFTAAKNIARPLEIAKAQAAANKISTAATDAAGLEGADPNLVATTAEDAVDEAGAHDEAAMLAAKLVAKAARDEAGVLGATSDSVAAAAVTAAAAAVGDPDVAAAADAAAAAVAGEAAPINRARLTFANGLVLEAASPGAWGNLLQVEVDYNTKPKDDGNSDASLYNLKIIDGSSGAVENIRNITGIATAVRLVSRVLTNESSLVRVVGTPPVSRPAAGLISVDPSGKAADSKPLDEDIDFIGDQDTKSGLYAFDKADIINLLCIPPDTRNGDIPVAVIQEAANYCYNCRRAMLIVDPPVAWSHDPNIAAATAVNGLPALGINGPLARNAALFFPRIKEFDPMREGQIDTFVPCGAVAGIFARTDSTRGVWKAPAGLDATFNGITGLGIVFTNGDNGQLNPQAINTLRSFRTGGQVIWGARTLRGADSIGDEYKYIPVRRLALFIEETLYRGTQWVVFEPNDEPLWAQVRLNVNSFMQTLFRKGAFQGTSPREAYFVKCDKETTLQDDIDRGILNILVGFAPLKPAEFVIIQIQQIAKQTQA